MKSYNALSATHDARNAIRMHRMKLALVVFGTMLAGCEGAMEQRTTRSQTGNQTQTLPSSNVTHAQSPASAPNTPHCVTTGPNSPIVVGASGVVVIDKQTYTPGQRTQCPDSVATHGANSPVVIGGGAVVIHKP